MRDRALLLLGFAAALRTHEVSELTQGDIEIQPRGLLLHIPGRHRPTAVPRDPVPAYCPVLAWDEWRSTMHDQGHSGPGLPAFPQLPGDRISVEPLHRHALNVLVRQRTAQAGLFGDYVFTSLRAGVIRTALRQGVPPHRIGAHADFQSLGGVQRHESREQLLRTSVAGMLGL